MQYHRDQHKAAKKRIKKVKKKFKKKNPIINYTEKIKSEKQNTESNT